MKQNFSNRLLDKRAQRVLAEIGGEPLDGSGFEAESPEAGFTAPSVPLAPAFAPAVPSVSGASMWPEKQEP
jgi:hypothetical protein